MYFIRSGLVFLIPSLPTVIKNNVLSFLSKWMGGCSFSLLIPNLIALDLVSVQ